MGFLSGLFHSRDKPTNSTNGSAYRFLFGGSNAGKAVNERSAMQMTAVYACVRILSESIAGLPVHIYKYTDSGSKEKAIKHPLYRLIHDEPNPEMTSFVFRETLMTHLLYGNAYAQIIRNGKGEVITLYPLMANRMSVDRDDKGHLYYQYQILATVSTLPSLIRKPTRKHKKNVSAEPQRTVVSVPTAMSRLPATKLR